MEELLKEILDRLTAIEQKMEPQGIQIKVNTQVKKAELREKYLAAVKDGKKKLSKQLMREMNQC